MLDLEVTGIIWEIFLSAKMKAAVHLGLDYEKNQFITKNTEFEQFKTMFDITKKLILEQRHEIERDHNDRMACCPFEKIHFCDMTE